MPTPTDPYSSAARRPFDEDDILAPIQPASQPTPEVASGYSSITAASAEEPRGMDPAFDSDPNTAGPTSLADALGFNYQALGIRLRHCCQSQYRSQQHT